MKKIFGTIFIALIGGFIALGAYKMIEDKKSPIVNVVTNKTPVQRVNIPSNSTGGILDFTAAAEISVHTVVHVKTVVESNNNYYNPWGDIFGNMPGSQMMEASGSGVILSQDGYIVTNNHVIENAKDIEITLNDNKKYKAELIGSDPAYDLALLKVDAENLPYSTFGDSEALKIGEWVLAVGNPYNLNSTVTAGIVSAKARNIDLLEYDPNNQIFPVESFIQTDAAVNPGNSGGALVNTRGELIGINTAIASKTGSYTGYSFAVPSYIVQKVVHDLMEYGRVERAYIGVELSNLSQELADQLEIDDVQGVYVSNVIEGSAADEGGVEKGDIITEISGTIVNSFAQLQGQISKYHPGDRIDIKVRRKDKDHTYNVLLQDRYGNKEVGVKAPSFDDESLTSLGAKFSPVDNNELQTLGIDNGVQISELGDGSLRRAGIREGLIITKIDKQEVSSPQDVVDILGSKEGGVLIEGVYPNGTTAYYGFGI